MKLSKAQKRTLEKMKPKEGYSAYDLQCSLATLYALRDKGFITSRADIGYFAFPRNGVIWKIKEENE